MSNKLVYKYTLGDQQWSLDFYDITLDESIQLEQATRVAWPSLNAAHDAASALAIKAFFWLARVKAGEAIAFDGPEMADVSWREFRRAVDTGQDDKHDEGEVEQADPSQPEQPQPPKATRTRVRQPSGSATS